MLRPGTIVAAGYLQAAAVLGALYVLLVLVVATGWPRPLDVALSVAAYGGLPCWTLNAGQAASVLLAGEVSLVYVGALALFCAWRRRPLLGVWLVGLMLATVPIEFGFKLWFDQPAPRMQLLGLDRTDCFRVAYPLTSVPTEVVPNSLPSGYSIRAAFFAVLLSALVGVRWPDLAQLARLVLLSALLLLGATRVAIAWHWTSDVLAGFLIGAAAACLALALADGFRWLRPPPTPAAREARR